MLHNYFCFFTFTLQKLCAILKEESERKAGIKLKNKKNVVQYSIKHQLLVGLFTIFLLFALLTTGGSAYFATLIRSQTYDNMKHTLELYENQMKKEFNTLEIYLYGNLNNSADITVLEQNQLDTSYYISLENLQNSLENILPCFSGINGLFVYSVRPDAFINYSSSTSADNYTCIRYLQNLLRTAKKENDLKSIDLRNWFAVKVGTSYYFIRIIRVGQSYVGAWANSESLLSVFNNITEPKTYTMFVSQNGRVMGNDDFLNLRFSPTDALSGYKMIKNPGGDNYLMITDKLDYCDYYLTTLVPGRELSDKLYNLRIALLLIGSMILTLGVFLIFLLNRYLSKPLKSLLVAIDSLRAGNFDTKVNPGNFQCEEFIQVNSAFNNMVDTIQKLKIDIYEEQLEHKQVELKYLKSQVAPHFLINCLNTIYYLSLDPQNQDIIRKMTIALSEHLRYTLANRTRVRLSEEMKYVANYLELSNLRFPGCMHYQSEIDPRTASASVFPLMILMFIENAVKYELVMGEELQIWVKAESISRKNGDGVHVTIIDSGDGYSKDFLDAIERPQYRPQNENGHHIGIENIIQRLKIEYGEDAFISFSNEPHEGARVDIEIPYQAYLADDLKTNDSAAEGKNL